MLKPIFEWVTGNYAIFENPLYNYIAIGIIGLIVFITAKKVVGDLY